MPGRAEVPPPLGIGGQPFGAVTMHVLVMEPAQQPKVVEGGGAAAGPGSSMVDIARPGWRLTVLKAAMAVPEDDRFRQSRWH
ncbi:MAG TPA: hypothetical protein VGF22_18845, partial [Acidimicrobiales bacterium]